MYHSGIMIQKIKRQTHMAMRRKFCQSEIGNEIEENVASQSDIGNEIEENVASQSVVCEEDGHPALNIRSIFASST